MSRVLTWPKATFRGVEFHVEGHGRSGGRRGPTHEYPGKDETYAEDMGAKAKRFTLNGYVAMGPGGGDYTLHSNALIAALEKPGPGELVHPTYGTLRVLIRDFSADESKDHIGFVVYRMSMDLATADKYPAMQRHPASGISTRAANAHDTVLAEFERRFVLTGKPDYLREEALGWFDQVIGEYERIGRVSGTSAIVGSLIADLSSLIRKVGTINDAAGVGRSLIAIPQAISGSFELPWRSRRNNDGTYRGVSTMRGGGPLDPDAVHTLVRMFSFGEFAVIPEYVTATRRQQLNNQNAIISLARQSAMVEAARLAPFVDWQTQQEAEEARDSIADALDVECENTPSDDVYQTLLGLRSLTLKSVPPEGGRLPSLVEYTPPATIPAIVLSYQLYGDIAKAEELLAINQIRHPGFIPGMEKIKVLADA